MGIFQKSVIQKHLGNLDKELVEKAYQRFRENYSSSKIEKIKELKEEEYQDGFLRDLFVDVFGYTLKPDDNYNLAREFKNQGDGKKADGAILKSDKAVAVIELKSTKTKDLKSITEQAFNYKNNQPECKYVITSNFHKLRFYIDYANEFEEFDLFHLQRTNFDLLFLILNSDSLFSDLPLKLKEETKFHEQDISDKLYKDYSVFKNRLFENLIKNNPENDKLTLFNKSQKLLDRFLFILFAEDSGLLPPNSISRIIDTYNKLEELYQEKPIYDIYKQYFGFLNTGRKGKTTADDIPAYNGGLFYTDDLLDNLKIDDKILIGDLLKLSEYDFNTEVDVNILGHIFEHSLSEIEEITAEIEGIATDKAKSKRKKDGVFYTPKYITQYIVENTIGTLCNEKRKELEIEEIEFDGTYRTKDGNLSVKGKKLFQKLNDYKDWMFSLKIVDPACGSGAFLNQALNFLILEHKSIDDIIAELTNTALRLFDTEKSILENNLFGVDINEESVEIAKLSLWLRTAHKDRKLSNLNNNIKCGNSLIDDPEVAGEKAFDWNVEFKEIMQNGGFDVVIGNPPYGADLKKTATFLKYNYKTFALSGESYILFVEKSSNLLRDRGRLGFIIPDTYLNLDFSAPLRKYLLANSLIEIIILLPANVFESATVDTTNLIIQKRKPTDSFYKNEVKIKILNKKSNSIDWNKFNKEFKISTEVWHNENSFLIRSNEDELRIITKVDNEFGRLETFAEMYSGIKCYEVDKGDPPQTNEIRDKKPFTSNIQVTGNWLPFFEGKHVDRYKLSWNDNSWLNYGVWLAAPREKLNFENEKILIRKIVGKTLICNYVQYTSYCNTLLFVLKLLGKAEINYHSLLGILNSKFIGWYYRHKFQISDDDTFPQIMIRDILKFPIPNKNIKNIDYLVVEILNKTSLFQNIKSKFLGLIQDNLELVKISKKLELFYKSDFKSFITEFKKQKIILSLSDQVEWKDFFEQNKSEINQLQNEINTTDKEIDQMVYELYGLTDDEIRLVEGN